MRDRHLLVMPPDHPLMRRRRVRWADLAAQGFVDLLQQQAEFSQQP